LGMNSIFLTAMGYQEEDHKQLIGKHHSIFVSYEYSKSDEYKKFWEKLREGKFFEGEFERKKIDGSPIYLQATYNPILNESTVITKGCSVCDSWRWCCYDNTLLDSNNYR
jgi:methyl-accepting chemotaxis protein